MCEDFIKYDDCDHCPYRLCFRCSICGDAFCCSYCGDECCWCIYVYTPCTCGTCSICREFGGKYGFGRVTNSGDRPTVGDALAILRHLVGLPSPIDTDPHALAASTILTRWGERPMINDALIILQFLIGIKSPLDRHYSV
jgi:hypothetical protein